MTNKRYMEEFKIEAVKQITERGHSAADVETSLGVSTYSLYQWVKHYSLPEAERATALDQQAEIHRLKSELKRVTEERDILKRTQGTLPRRPGEVRIYPERGSHQLPDTPALQDDGGTPERVLRLVHNIQVAARHRRSTAARSHQAVLTRKRHGLRLSQGAG